jgi:hypothetical protein
MYNNLYKKLLLFVLCLISFNAFSQSVTDAKIDSILLKSDTAKKTAHKSSIKFGVNYVSNNIFMGRSDTIRTPTIIPEIKYTFKSGLYVSGTVDIIPDRKKNKVDGGSLSLGYDFDLSDDLSGGISYSKPFYSSTSTQVTSSISSTFTGDLTYDIGDIISPNISIDYNINKQGISGDVFLNFGLTHDFISEGIFGRKDILLISPTAAINSGTQNFYDGYIVYRKLKTVKRDATETKAINAYTSQLSEFKVLDYEFSVPIEYKAGSFILQFTPIYALAQNQFKSAAIVKTLALSDQSSVFYFDLGVALKF